MSEGQLPPRATGAGARTSRSAIVERIRGAGSVADPRLAYLLLASADGVIPRPSEIQHFTRHWMMYGLDRALASARGRRVHRGPIRLTDSTLVDVTNTVEHSFVTGIQRVAKETAKEWMRGERPVTLVRWDRPGRRLLELTARESARVLDLPDPGDDTAPAALVPVGGEVILPEISTAARRTESLHTVAEFSDAVCVAIGHDCIPITSTETAGRGMPGAFSRYLATLARFDALAPVSESSGTEFRGWRRMLSGAGLHGPEITVNPLPARAAGTASSEEVERVRREIGLSDESVVLVVGSREPRKNQIRVLEAAELAWRSGAQFALVLVGGNAWATEAFDRQLERLRRHGRHVVTLAGVPDSTIWSLYQMATLTVFPSLNEGFGLPVVESLAHGTPVVTSGYGSMRDLGEGRGALLVDPRDSGAIARAVLDILEHPDRRARLAEQTRLLDEGTWSEYARSLRSIVDRARRVRSERNGERIALGSIAGRVDRAVGVEAS